MADVELRLQADLTDAQRNIAGFRKEYGALVREVEKPLRQVNAFRDLETALESTQRGAKDARERVRDLGNQMAAAAIPSKALQQSYRDAVSDLQRLERQEATHVTRLTAMRRELKAAGVDTQDLAAEQARLRREYSHRVQSGVLASSLASSRNNLGLDQYQALRQELARLTADYQRLTKEGTLSATERAVAEQTYRAQLEKTQAAMARMRGDKGQDGSAGGGALLAARSTLGAAGVLGVGLGVAAALTAKLADAIGRATDPIKQIDAQLKNATSTTAEYSRAQEELLRISEETQTPLATNVGLYARMSPALKEAGRSQTEALGVIEAVGLTLKISGASAEESAGAILQFSQALGSGVLRGDEFNSVAEQSPRLMRALAEGMKVPVSALRDLAAQGKLTADIIVDALTKQLPSLRQEAEGFGNTYAGAMQNLGTASQQMIKDLDEVTGASSRVVSGINAITQAIKNLPNAANTLGQGFKQISGNLGEVETLQRKISILNTMIDTTPDNGSVSREGVRDGLRARRDAIQKELDALLSDQRAAAVESGKINSQTNSEARASQEAYQRQLTQHRNKLKSTRDQIVSDAKAAISEQEKLEQAQQGKIDDILADRKEIQKRFTSTVSQLRNGTAEPSYGAAQDLKASAQSALRQGDFKTAMEQAEQARQMLLDMQQAGQSTYGLEGFAKQLQAIELAANDLEKTDADKKLDAISTKLADLKSKASELENLQVTPTLDDAAAADLVEKMKALAKQIGTEATVTLMVNPIAPSDAMKAGGLEGSGQVNFPGALQTLQVPVQPSLDQQAAAAATSQVQALIEQLKQQAVIPLTVAVGQAGTADAAAVPGFATGGQISGPGTGTSDSILARLSNGEFVMRAAAVRHYGPDLLEQLNARLLPRFATGGAVGRVPAIPPVAAALLQGGDQAFLGTMDLALPGGDSLTVSVPANQRSELEIARKKFGRTRTRG
ncbi:tape measure protein [Pseudomonas psychrotolerans]|uniref:tape measure protein n=3 Tax=Pseudomonas oryzihabitans TaxID=47885 RepID=UPI0015E42713|nr:tape measure protein [Pseudomonas psychrotolerans]MBA1179533.1 tape measure protein [Pseudomonas psychrotolerans]